MKSKFYQDDRLVAQIIDGDEKSLELLMDRYIQPLCSYVKHLTGSNDLSEEVVADVFIGLWKIKAHLIIKSSLRAYLYRSCRNRALDLLKKEKKHGSENLEDFDSIKGGLSPEADLNVRELHREIDALISEMPRQRQLVFRLSRIDGLKYKEIAGILSISVNTVQNHMVEAVRFMATRKSDFF